MSQPPRSSLQRLQRQVGLALLALALAVLARKLFLGALGGRIVWVTFYPAVIIGSLYGGWPVGLMTGLGSCLLALFGWPLLVDQPFIKDYGDRLGMFAFLFNSALITGLAHMARRARLRAIQAKEQAEAATQAKSAVLASMSQTHLSLHEQGLELNTINQKLETEMEERQRVERELRTALELADRSRRAMLGTLEDQHAAETALRSSEQSYRVLFEANPQPMWIYDLGSLTFLAVNDAAVAQYGYSREEFLRMSIKEIRPSEEVPTLLERLADPTRPIGNSGILRHRKKAGEIILVETLSHAMSWVGRPARVVVAQDVTLRERSREELQASEINLRATFDQALVGMALLDFDHKLLQVNRRFAEILGRTQEELIGADPSSMTHPEDRLPTGASIQAILHGLGGSLIQEQRYLKPDGTPVWIQLQASIVSPDSSESGYVLEVVEDITERKRMEAEIQGLNRDLEHRVEQRTQQLEATNQELEAFAYSVSHDLRAPLRTISGFSEALSRDGDSVLSPEGLGHLQRIQGGALRMAQLIEDLLQLSRVGQDDCEMVPLDLGVLAEQVLAKLKEGEPERSLVWEVQHPIAIKGNPRLLRVLLENLLGNAWKFTSRTAAPRIWVSAQPIHGASMEVIIRDNGAGFVSSQANRLFTPFQRLHKVEEFPGTGIGLAIAKRIVSRHGGAIRAEGAAGQGATLAFTLPKIKELAP